MSEPQRQVQVKFQPGMPSMMYVPEEVREHFSGKGKAVELESDRPEWIMIAARLGRYPVLQSELNEELVQVLRRCGFKVRPDETVGIADTLLFQQDEENRRQAREWHELQWDSMVGGADRELKVAEEDLRRATGDTSKLRTNRGGIGTHIFKG